MIPQAIALAHVHDTKDYTQNHRGRGKTSRKKGIHLMRYLQCFLAALLVVVVLASTTPPALAAIRTIDIPGAGLTSATGINDSGQIVGYYAAGGPFHGFVLDK